MTLDYEARKFVWDAVDWQNTHLTGLDDRDMHHVGRTSAPRDGDLVVLRLGSDNDTKPHHTILLTPDQAHDLAAALRMVAR
jgi:hypothetical protein